jgi:antirestriction protein ArdC
MARKVGQQSGGESGVADRGAGKSSLYQEVTDRIIRELEQGRVRWVQPWGSAKAALGLPKNAATSRAYSGINVLVLWGAVIKQGFPAQQWLTFRQALTLAEERAERRLAATLAAGVVGFGRPWSWMSRAPWPR